MQVQTPGAVARRLETVLRAHSGDLMPGESLLSACDCGPISLLSSKQRPNGFLANLGLLGFAIHRFFEKRRARDRSATLMQSIAYAAQGEVVELPEAARGCVLVLTSQRVLIYDRKVKQKLTECPTVGVTISANDHGLNKTSLVFSNGVERFAVAVAEGATEMSRHVLSVHGAIATGAGQAARAQ